ncbi:carbohydrate ABC transporter permease [Paenibacillus sp. GCM10027626]|uniref:carbohydrate ABC transporter permease n=1 Tax=Paenibacillus sp. GCM10027626 TaxID=3273411 RepID=UPI00363C7023
MNLSAGERKHWFSRLFDLIVGCIIVFVCVVTLYPFVYVASVSVSETASVIANEVTLLPKGFNLAAYETVFRYNGIWVAYGNTLFYTGIGTIVSLLLTVLAAYPLSRKDWRFRPAATLIVAVTMWFGGGMIPFYLVVKDLGLLNTRFIILIYAALSAFLVFVMRTYFDSLPKELEESARIDGASDLRLLFQIVLPLSKPVLAVIGLYYAVGKWNSYLWEMIFLHRDDYLPLQVLLVRIVKDQSFGSEIERAITQGVDVVPITIQYAAIVVAIVPILLVYPFLQKYFVKGVMIGAIKS